jgi:DNA-binding protein WhiA
VASLVEELWDEWTSFPVLSGDAASLEVAGIIAGLRPGERERNDSVRLGSSRPCVLRRLLKLWKSSRWGEALNLADRMLIPESMKGRVRLALPLEIHREIVGCTPSGNWDWLRGAWGSCGALYFPKSGYYLVMRFGEGGVVTRVRKLLQRARVPRSERTVHGAYEIILRNQEEIVTFLSKIGLTGISLRVEDRAILRSMRDRANRMRNCDTANIRKSLRVAEKQLELALRLQRDNLVETLPASLRDLVEARLACPEASLSELGDVLSPPVTKSTIKYRWKRLCEFMGETDGFEQ